MRATLPTLVDFSADWCGPCRRMAAVVDALADEFQGRANVVKVNVDESPEIASRYGVHSIPTFIMVRDGIPGERLLGVQTRQALAMAIAP